MLPPLHIFWLVGALILGQALLLCRQIKDGSTVERRDFQFDTEPDEICLTYVTTWLVSATDGSGSNPTSGLPGGSDDDLWPGHISSTQWDDGPRGNNTDASTQSYDGPSGNSPGISTQSYNELSGNSPGISTKSYNEPSGNGPGPGPGTGTGTGTGTPSGTGAGPLSHGNSQGSNLPIATSSNGGE